MVFGHFDGILMFLVAMEIFLCISKLCKRLKEYVNTRSFDFNYQIIIV